MLLSMTGFGEAHRKDATMAVSAEVRTINSRYFKLVVRCGDGYTALEPLVDNVVRRHIKRGAVQVSLRIDRARGSDDYKLDAAVLGGYRRQLDELSKAWKLTQPLGVEALLALPGVVVQDPAAALDVERDWPLVDQTLQAAIEKMSLMRADEGRAMAADLKANLALLARELDAIDARAPLVADSYRARLMERLTKALEEFQITLQPADLIRELSIYAERSDISEEIVRLRSHLEQFAATLEVDESSGRKLEFLTQEISRETNTIGSKANDVQISRHVIEIKAATERIREMIQNVE
ncbi:MAG: YicC/YloC family endoribonuclease [Pirellulales bacterium]